MNECPGLLGRKIGMTQLFTDEGKVLPVTVIEAGPCQVIQVMTEENGGYNAIQLGFGERKEKHTNKAQLGHYKKANLQPSKFVQEIRLSAEDVAKYEVGQSVTISDVFEEGEKLDVRGTSKGKGTAGVMKRHNFAGFIRTHGTHEFFRHGGSIGTRLTPGHVAKGTRMGGQMGNERVTVHNLELSKMDAEKNLLFVKGGVPGANGGYVVIRKGIKANN
ncbi:MAG: 50S ribosomal protein L3 [Myxococcota bacterium]|nr:50S ribosomal protein L3 [Myxococcota bacterium]